MRINDTSLPTAQEGNRLQKKKNTCGVWIWSKLVKERAVSMGLPLQLQEMSFK